MYNLQSALKVNATLNKKKYYFFILKCHFHNMILLFVNFVLAHNYYLL